MFITLGSLDIQGKGEAAILNELDFTRVTKCYFHLADVYEKA
jgi:hypothetical protein